jgi:hypothetical protein
MAIFSRMHSLSAGLKFYYFNRATNGIGKLYIYWLYVRQKYFGGRRRCDRGRCKTLSPRAEVVESRRNTPKAASPTRGGAAVAKGRNGGLADRGDDDVWTDWDAASRERSGGSLASALALARPAGLLSRNGR